MLNRGNSGKSLTGLSEKTMLFTAQHSTAQHSTALNPGYLLLIPIMLRLASAKDGYPYAEVLFLYSFRMKGTYMGTDMLVRAAPYKVPVKDPVL